MNTCTLSISGQREDVQEKTDLAENEARGFAAEILEVKQCLAEPQTRSVTGTC